MTLPAARLRIEVATRLMQRPAPLPECFKITLCACVLAGAQARLAATPGAAGQVIERGRNFKIIEQRRATTDGAGRVSLTTHRYTALADGMHRKDAAGQFVESRPVIAEFGAGILGYGAAYCVILQYNLNTAGAVDLEMEGVWLISRRVGIAFFDPESGRSVWPAQVADHSLPTAGASCATGRQCYLH